MSGFSKIIQIDIHEDEVDILWIVLFFLISLAQTVIALSGLSVLFAHATQKPWLGDALDLFLASFLVGIGLFVLALIYALLKGVEIKFRSPFAD